MENETQNSMRQPKPEMEIKDALKIVRNVTNWNYLSERAEVYGVSKDGKYGIIMEGQFSSTSVVIYEPPLSRQASRRVFRGYQRMYDERKENVLRDIYDKATRSIGSGSFEKFLSECDCQEIKERTA